MWDSSSQWVSGVKTLRLIATHPKPSFLHEQTVGGTGIFKPGKADVNAYAQASTGDGEYANDSASLTVRLRGQGKYVPVPPLNPYP